MLLELSKKISAGCMSDPPKVVSDDIFGESAQHSESKLSNMYSMNTQMLLKKCRNWLLLVNRYVCDLADFSL